MDFSPDKLRARFAELSKKYDAIDAKRTALQKERDGKIDSMGMTQEKAYAERIKKLHAEAAPIEEERAAISRALNGQTA